METSGPIRKDIHLAPIEDWCNFQHFTGNLYKATCDGKMCILKTARTQTTESAVLLKREYEISCNLQHPYILTPLKYSYETPAGEAIIMEYIDGCTLTEFLSKCTSKDIRKRLLSEILDAVDYLHKKGLLHNDLKTDNILVSNIGNHIKIIDFGFSETDAEYLTRRLGGTTEISAPEVLEGDTHIPSTASSDIYSIGHIIQALFPNRYKSIVKQCLKDNPNDRYQDIDTLKVVLLKSDRLHRVRWIFPLAVIALILLAMVPHLYNRSLLIKESHRDSSFLAKIEEEIEQMYLATKDTLENPAYVPYLNFGRKYTQNWIDAVNEYKIEACPEEYHAHYRTLFDKYLNRLNQIVMSKPTITDARNEGIITEEESEYYWSLVLKNKPFKSFSHK